MAEDGYLPNIVVFACNWGGYPLLSRVEPDPTVNLRLLRLMCGGRTSAGLLLRALELGADGVAVFTCDEKECHYGFGAPRGKEEFELAKRMCGLLGVEDERLVYRTAYTGDIEKAREDMRSFIETVKKLGKSSIVLGEAR